LCASLISGRRDSFRQARSLQVGTNEVDEVFGEFRGDLLFCAVDEVEADMGFEDFTHKSVDAAADGSEEHKLCAAVFIGKEGALNGIELAAEFADSLKEFYFFAFLVGHGVSPVDNTHPRYGIYGVGV